MTIDFCDLCGDPCTGKNPWIGNNNSQETWRTLVAQALCALSTNTPGVIASVQLPQFVATAAQITASYAVYASPSFIDTGLTLRRLRVINTTDADIEVSFDGGVTTHLRVLAGTSENFDLGKIEFSAANKFMIRKSLTMTAGIGSVYIEGGY